MKFWKKAVLLGVVALSVGSVSEALAEGGVGDGPVRKFGRGISNAAFGALELPVTVYDMNFEEGGIAACTYGVLKGVCRVVGREVVGVVEIITFPMPLPGCPDDSRDAGWGYGSMMDPEWIIDTDHNAYNIVYQKTSTMD